MKSRNLTNESISQIGEKVLKAVRATDEDINAVIGAEDLFEPVRTAIRGGRTQVASMPPFTQQHIFGWRLAFATVAAFFIAASGAVYFIRHTGLLPETVQAP